MIQPNGMNNFKKLISKYMYIYIYICLYNGQLKKNKKGGKKKLI